MLSRRAVAAVLFLGAVAGFAAVVWWFAFMSALDQTAERGRADLALATDRLKGQLQQYRELAVFLSDHPALTPLVLEERPTQTDVSAFLRQMADKTGTGQIQLVGRSGQLLSSTGPDIPAGAAPAIDRALSGALGSAHFVEADELRYFTFAAPVFRPRGAAWGAVLTTVDIGGIERNWPNDPSPVFFTDDRGVVFISNRSELTLTNRLAGDGYTFPDHTDRMLGGHSLWRLDGGRYLPTRALHLTQDVPVLGMRGEILLDLSPAANLALLQAAMAAALCLAFGALLFLATERRRSLDDRLKTEAANNAALEARVQARTRALSTANKSLRREIAERQEAEAALRRAQADLVQAGKLSALGQMSAGISHELNQPLMAIGSFAENAQAFLDKNNPQRVRENLGRISEMARRMGRIIKNLRAFARQETEALGNVNLAGVVDAALELLGPRLAEAEVKVEWAAPPIPVMVRGGEVRLQQVVTNLVSNAVDAMADQPDRRVSLWIEADRQKVRLHVRDTGPGISDPGKIFDPFYSTKEVGISEGMGLGLSISYGLVQSFGGAITGRNDDQGGAVFTVELTAAGLEAAA